MLLEHGECHVVMPGLPAASLIVGRAASAFRPYATVAFQDSLPESGQWRFTDADGDFRRAENNSHIVCRMTFNALHDA